MGHSIVVSLDRDHERLIQISDRLGSASRGRESLGNQLRTLFVGHLRAETAVACRVVGHGGYAGAERQAMPSLDALAAGAEDPRLLAEWQAWLADHIADVRRLVLALRADSGPGRLEQIAVAYEHRRAVEAAALRPVRSTPRRLDRSRTELYEQARRAGITGRSAMTRAELIEALQHAVARAVPEPRPLPGTTR